MASVSAQSEAFTTGGLAAVSGYSVQQVRDLERLGVIPPAVRRANGYRGFGPVHVVALRAYRQLAVAVGPVVARTTMREARELPRAEAIAHIVDLHVVLARSREDTLAALRALDRIVQEGAHDASAAPADAMTITELAAALGVRSSTLRFWEHEGLLAPERAEHGAMRRYPVAAIRAARLVAALRAGGYGIPAVRDVMASLRDLGDPDAARSALEARLDAITTRSAALLRAGAELVGLLGE